MKRIMKSSLIFLVMGFSLNSYSATIPAQTFSRANCKVYIPSFGYGYYNEYPTLNTFRGLKQKRHELKL